MPKLRPGGYRAAVIRYIGSGFPGRARAADLLRAAHRPEPELTHLTTRPASPSPAPQNNPGRNPSPQATQLANDIAAFLGANQVENLAILEVAGPLAIVDYFVIGTVRNTRQSQAIARDLDQEMKALRGKRKRNQGGMETADSNWVLLDFDDVVVHLLLPEARAYYDLESLWADVPRLPVPAPAEDKKRAAEPRRGKHIQIFPTDPES